MTKTKPKHCRWLWKWNNGRFGNVLYLNKPDPPLAEYGPLKNGKYVRVKFVEVE